MYQAETGLQERKWIKEKRKPERKIKEEIEKGKERKEANKGVRKVKESKKELDNVLRRGSK
jgi:hypothetical protein